MNDNNLLFLVIKEFNNIDLHPEAVSNQEMGYIFEELIRRFSENAEAGDHFTPREVIELMFKEYSIMINIEKIRKLKGPIEPYRLDKYILNDFQIQGFKFDKNRSQYIRNTHL